jgi:4-amino-4-deoxy-L-arabinose transferase-like glycosyltransferase
MTLDNRRVRRYIVVAAAAGLLLRLAFGLYYWVDRPLTHDEREYLALAQSLTEGRGFTYPPGMETGTAPRFGRPPGYPAFLAAIGAGRTPVESSPVRAKVAQAIVGAAVVWLIGTIAWRTAGPRSGVAAAAIAAVYPPLVWTPAYVFSETLYSLVALSMAVVLDKAANRKPGGSRWPGLAAGVLMGAAALVRAAMIVMVPLALLWLLRRRDYVTALALVAGLVAVVGPWTLRNARVHGRFIPIASEGGVTFWTGNHPLGRGEGDLAANPDLKKAELAFRTARPGLTAEQLEGEYYADAFAYIRGNPGAWLKLLARKAFYTIVPAGPSYTLHSTKYLVASVASYVLLLPFAVAGFGRVWRSRSRPTALLLLAASAALTCIVFFPQERFRIPVIDPFLIVCAACAPLFTSRD